MMSEFSRYRIIDLLESEASSFVKGEIKNFSSTYRPAFGTIPAQKNDDVELFLKKKAENFSRQNLSMTHLVLSSANQELLDVCMAKIKECQDVVGGGIVFLECEKKENDTKLTDFYHKNGFVEYNMRNNLVQMVQRI